MPVIDGVATPYPEQTVTLRVLVRGYDEALLRFQAVVDSREPADAFLPLFEVLNWATAIHERCAADFAPDGLAKTPGRDWQQRMTGLDTMHGIAFVRNRVHHQWADAVESREAVEGWSTWFWRPIDDLPRGRPDPTNQQHYEADLAGRLVEPSLASLGVTFALMCEVLEPIISAR